MALHRDKLLYHIIGKMGAESIPCDANVAQRVRHYRKQQKVKAETLAEFVGLSRYTIMRYESGETEPPLEDMKKIATALEIEPDMLYDDYYRFLD